MNMDKWAKKHIIVLLNPLSSCASQLPDIKDEHNLTG